MKTATLIKFAASSFVLGTIVTGCSQGHMPVASASQPAQFAKAAEKFAQQASKAMAKGKYGRAVDLAERAVAGAPDNAAYRAILGQGYLNLGRFTSAEDALGDSLSLDPSNGKAALNLALAQIANGKNDAAMRTLDDHRSSFSAADYGLAVALAGDPAGAVTVLETASRDGRADTKLRQNLALSYALAGKWANARVMAAQDLSPDMLDARMTEWAQFVRPNGASQQVASLLGVTPVSDAGMPSQLALQRSSEPAPAANTAAVEAPFDIASVQVDTGEPTAVPTGDAAPAFEMAASAPAAEAPLIMSASTPTKVRQTIVPAVQRAPKQFVREAAAPAKPLVRTAATKPSARPAPVAKAKAIESGTYVVQLGAFASSTRAQAAWNGAVTKTAELGKYVPATSRVKTGSASLYRMAVTGFTSREVAGQLCTRIKAKGGTCFVRSIVNDAPTQWVQRGGARVASR
jgi:Flp pilus assembly protein TadD